MSNDRDTTMHSRDANDLRAACKREGCPVCIVVLENMDRAMESWQYEGFTDAEHRKEVMRTRGFCPLHTWQLAQRNNAFQLAVIYREVLTDLLETMSDEQKQATHPPRAPEENWILKVKRWFQSGSPGREDIAHLFAGCPLCRTCTNAEQRVIGRLVELLPSQEMQSLLRQSTGLCRLHFFQTTQSLREKASLHTVLVACQRTCLQRTLDEVKELLRKHDYHASAEPRGEEMTAWRRAAQLCAGNPGVH